MAVTIEEMHVDVAEPMPAPTEAAGSEAKEKTDLRSALEMLHERKLRLLAD